jgi:predicted TIM-barrel fold metal-dependent hydrolase
MSDQRLTIVSADCHAGPDRMEDFRDYVEPKHRAAYDDYLARLHAYDAGYDDALSRGGATSARTAGEEGLWDVGVRERCLDGDGVSAEVIFTQGSIPFGRYPAVSGRDRFLDHHATPEQLTAGCRAYNRWLAELCSNAPQRHIGVARVPLPDVEAAVAEVEFARKAGLRGGILLPSLTGDMPIFNDPVYEPLWAACEANEMPLNMHGGASIAYGGGPENFALVLAETDWWSHRGLAHLIFAGVFERHPKLHLAITEQRTHWAAPLLKELDSNYASFANAGLRKILPRKPSEYFRSNCFLGASFMSRPECAARDDVGVECFMWGSDYPHGEGTWPYTDTALRWTFGSGVPSSDLRAMLSENAARCYHLDLQALRPIADRIGPKESDLRIPVDQLPTQGPAGASVRSWAFRSGPWH